MCGFAGIIDFQGRSIDIDRLRAAQGQLGHRGPDDRDLFIREASRFSVGLAHTRLAVIDPSPHARQPMRDGDERSVLVFNGEIYNFRELARELPELDATDSDTHVLLHACLAHRERILPRLDAMFAFAWINLRTHEGFLARDPFGIKPMYYAIHDDRLFFASELKALLRLGDLPTDIDSRALGLYLNLGFIPHPFTIYRNIFKLSPGHHLSFDASGPRSPERVFQLDPPLAEPPPFDEAAAELRERISRAVARQTIADVPLGAFLSGGLDSSIVVACLAEHADHTPKTFSIGYPEHPMYDESAYARRVAEHFGTEHHHLPVTFDDVIATVVPMLDHLGEPFADSSLIPSAILSRHTREHVTVALSGDGGDELFGGYWRYLGHHYLDRYHRLPAVVRGTLIEPLLRLAPEGKSNRLFDRVRQFRKLLRGDHPDPLQRHLAWARNLSTAQSAKLFNEDMAERIEAGLRDVITTAAKALQPAGAPAPEGLAAILQADLSLSLPADMLFKVDTASMAHSLEVRVPLLDIGVVRYAASLPVEYHIQGTDTKRLLRHAFADMLPESILRRRKMGFEVPVGEFLRVELNDLYRQTVTPDTLRELGLNPDAAVALHKQHLARKQDHTPLLWSLLTVCHWWQKARHA